MPRMQDSVPSPSPSHFSSWPVPPPEMGFALDTSTSGPQNSDPPAYTNLPHDFPRHGSHGQDFFPPSRGYNSHAPEPPFASPQFSVSSRGTMDPLITGPTAYAVVYTDDTTVKLTSRVRRQCFNCNSKATTTWRRSMLMFGKWVCDFFCLRESIRKAFLFLKTNIRRFATSAGCLSELTQLRGQRRSRAGVVLVRHLHLNTRTRTRPCSTILNIVIMTTVPLLVTFPAPPLAPRAVIQTHRTRPG